MLYNLKIRQFNRCFMHLFHLFLMMSNKVITMSFFHLDQPILTLSPDTTQGSMPVLPSDTWMLLGAVVIFRSAGQRNQEKRSLMSLFSYNKFLPFNPGSCPMGKVFCFVFL